MPWASLALRAQVRATAGYAHLDNSRAATRTSLTFSPKYPGEIQVAPSLAFGVHVILITGAALFYR